MKGTRREILAIFGFVVGSLAMIIHRINPMRSDGPDGNAGSDDPEDVNGSENGNDSKKINPPEAVNPPKDVEVAEGTEMFTDLHADFRDWSWMDQFTESDPIGNVYLTRDSAYYERSLRVEIPKGTHYGTSLHYLFSEESWEEPEVLWASYYVYFPESFNPKDHVGKLPGPAGTYENGGWGGRQANGTNGWSARMGFRRDGSDKVGLDYYVYHADMDGYFGDLFNWDRSVLKGRWHRIDQYIRLNDPSKNNGVLAGWVNGEKAYDRRDIRFRETSELKIEDYWFTVYWGGMSTSPADNEILFDSLTIRRPVYNP